MRGACQPTSAGDMLSAEGTRRSAEMLGLEEGRAVTLLFNALSVEGIASGGSGQRQPPFSKSV